jgi:hypothetical protein
MLWRNVILTNKGKKNMNEYTETEQNMIAAASDLYESGSRDKSIAIGLTQGDGWWGSVLATGIYESPQNDLAADFHDFCVLNNLDRTEIRSAEYFIRELKAHKLLNDIKKDFE